MFGRGQIFPDKYGDIVTGKFHFAQFLRDVVQHVFADFRRMRAGFQGRVGIPSRKINRV